MPENVHLAHSALLKFEPPSPLPKPLLLFLLLYYSTRVCRKELHGEMEMCEPNEPPCLDNGGGGGGDNNKL